MPFKFEIAPVVAGEISFYVELIIPHKFVPSENPEEETGKCRREWRQDVALMPDRGVIG